MADTSIEWTEKTWNPVAGCTVLSPGCTNCYAMRMASRLEAMGSAKYKGLTRKSGGRPKWTGVVRIDRSSLEVPLSWSKPQRVFVNSMSDLFHERIPAAFVGEVWEVMGRASKHTFQILTKRPDRMAALTRDLPVLQNVWLGASVENADFLSRIDELRLVPAHVRFVSLEPLIGPLGTPDFSDIHWAIVGGESGPGARPIERGWVDDIHKACRMSGTAFFFKQWGGKNKKRSGRKIDGKTWDEYPVRATSGYVPQSHLPA